MKKIFDRKLYFEGLKRARLIGIIFGSIVLLLTSFTPLMRMTSVRTVEYTIKYESFAMPVVLMLFFTPFFFTSIFSFLNKRKACDFYHAIPHTRGCLYTSFTASALTWIGGIIVATSLWAGLLWSVCPMATFDLGLIPLTIILHLLGCIYIGGFVVLAISMTGTKASNFIVACLLLFSVRIFGFYCIRAIENVTLIYDVNFGMLSFFSMRNWLPAAVIDSFESFAAFESLTLWILSGVVILGSYLLGFFVFKARSSEMANKSAPGKVMQCIFRCLFTLPFALLATMSIILDDRISYTIITVSITLLVFFLYELITSKKVKTALKTMPLFLAVIAVCGLFCGVVYGTEAMVCAGDYTAAEMESVALYNNSNSYQTRVYEELALQNTWIDDQRAKEIIEQALSESLKQEKNHAYVTYPDVEAPRYVKYVKVRLHSGKIVGRKLWFTQDLYNELKDIFWHSDKIHEKYIELPPDATIKYLYVGGADPLSNEQVDLLWTFFKKEYGELTAEEKEQYKKRNSDNKEKTKLSFRIYGIFENNEYEISYKIYPSFKKTTALYYSMVNDWKREILTSLESISSMKYLDFNYMLYYTDKRFMHLTFLDESVTKMYQYDWYRKEDHKEGLEKYTVLQEIVTILLPYLDTDPMVGTTLEIRHITDHDGKTAFFGLKDMSKEDEERIYQLLKELNTGFESNHPS